MPVRATLIFLILAMSFVAAAEAPQQSPDWSLATVNGETVNLGETVSERPVVLFFWATWCPFCRR